MGKKRTEPERIAIPMPKKLIERINEFRWRERIPSRAQAIRTLIEQALDAAEQPPKPPNDN